MERHSETGLKLIKSSRYVEDSVVTNAPDIGPVLNEDFLASVERWRASRPAAAAAVTAPSFSDVLLILKDRLAVSRRRMAKADREHVECLRHFLEMRTTARDVNQEVFTKMSATRRTFEEHFPGSENAFVLGAFQSPTAPDTTLLLEQAATVLERLKSPDFVLPEPLIQAVKVDAEELVTELDSELERLRTSDEQLRLARRKAQRSRKNKNRAVQEHGRLFLRIARMFEGFYLMAGEPELAAQIRPSGHRPGRRAVEVAAEEAAKQGKTGDSNAGESASEPPAAGEQAADPSASPESPAPAEASGSSDSEATASDTSS